MPGLSGRIGVGAAVLALLVGVMGATPPPGGWTELAPGLDLGRFPAEPGRDVDAATITVLRVDPARWRLTVLASSDRGRTTNLDAAGWCREYGLVAAVNAGMFSTDFRTHTGYLRCGGHLNNPGLNRYQSVAVFGPRRDDLPAFRIHDLDEIPFEDFAGDYDFVVQNLRLIKRPAQNRWSPQARKWSEAALGEDGRGRALLIFCRRPFAMHDLNRRLLELPIDLVCAQHLEGGPEAQLYLGLGKTIVDLVGGLETDFREDGRNAARWPVPNVIGVVARED